MKRPDQIEIINGPYERLDYMPSGWNMQELFAYSENFTPDEECSARIILPRLLSIDGRYWHSEMTQEGGTWLW